MGGRGSSSGRAGGTLKSNITHPELAKDDKFFGKTQYYSNKYFSYDSVIDKDNIIVRTNNVKMIKGNPVLIVDNDKGIYLKDWQVAPIKMDRGETNTYAVKLNRNYMKEYNMTSEKYIRSDYREIHDHIDDATDKILRRLDEEILNTNNNITRSKNEILDKLDSFEQLLKNSGIK